MLTSKELSLHSHKKIANGMTIHVARLAKNGFTVVFLDNPSMLKTYKASITVRTGLINESKKENGISHFIEHCVFNGSETHPSEEALSKAYFDFGCSENGVLNAETGELYTAFSSEGLSELAKESLGVLVNMVYKPLFRQEDIEKEKLIVLQELQENTDSNGKTTNDGIILNSLISRDHPLSREILGTAETINSFNKQKLKAYHKKWYQPENSFVVIEANHKYIDVDTVFELFENVESDGKFDKELIFKDPFEIHKQPTFEDVLIINRATGTNSEHKSKTRDKSIDGGVIKIVEDIEKMNYEVMVESRYKVHGPLSLKSATKRVFAEELASINVFGSSFGVLFKKARGAGLVYGLSGGYGGGSPVFSRAFSLGFGVDLKNVTKLTDLIRETVTDIATGDDTETFSDENILRAIRMIRFELLRSQETGHALRSLPFIIVEGGLEALLAIIEPATKSEPVVKRMRASRALEIAHLRMHIHGETEFQIPMDDIRTEAIKATIEGFVNEEMLISVAGKVKTAKGKKFIEKIHDYIEGMNATGRLMSQHLAGDVSLPGVKKKGATSPGKVVSLESVRLEKTESKKEKETEELPIGA